MTINSPERRDTRRRRQLRTLGIWLAVVLGIAFLMFSYHHLSVVAEGGRRPAIKALINELTAAFGAGVLFWGVRAMVLRWPLTGERWLGRLPIYVGGLLTYSALHTSSNWGLRALLFPLAGQGRYDYGIMPVRYAMELPIDVISFAIMVGVVRWVQNRQHENEQNLRALNLERSLTEARLANLRLQLQPHFLFNALNTISATMYRDVDEADGLLERLGDLLRGSLSTERGDLVPLSLEIDWLRSYVALLEARFEDRLEVDFDLGSDLEDVLVPAMVLQPLVENAVRHGGVEKSGQGRIEIRCRRDGDAVELSVADDGPGAQQPIDPLMDGFGLRSVAERLRLLYGDRQSLHLDSAQDSDTQRGFTAALRFPVQPDESRR